MCLILLAWRAHPGFPLVVAANRDEFFARRTAGARFWDEAPHVLAGRDLEGGGTWLGITHTGRFAALTNFRDRASIRPDAPSRGELVSRFLTGTQPPQAFLGELGGIGDRYNGFNLLFSDNESLWYFSNREAEARHLPPGVYGLSNHLLDTPWPKVARGKSALSAALGAAPEQTSLFALLRDDTIAVDAALPRTGVSLAWERLLSAAFVRSPDYGTRSATVVIADRAGRISFSEQEYLPGAQPGARRDFEFCLTR